MNLFPCTHQALVSRMTTQRLDEGRAAHGISEWSSDLTHWAAAMPE